MFLLLIMGRESILHLKQLSILPYGFGATMCGVFFRANATLSIINVWSCMCDT